MRLQKCYGVSDRIAVSVQGGDDGISVAPRATDAGQDTRVGCSQVGEGGGESVGENAHDSAGVVDSLTVARTVTADAPNRDSP